MTKNLYSKDEVAEIRRYVKSYITKLKNVNSDITDNVSTIWEFSEFIELPVKLKKVPNLSSPVEIQWEATNICNHNCYFCYFADRMNIENNILSTEQVKKIVDEADELKTVVLTIEGGEPFMRKDMLDILEYIRNNTGISMDILTNGSLITTDIAEKLFSILGVNQDAIRVSLIAHDRKNHEQICGKDTFEIINNNVKNLTDNDVSVRVNTVVTEYTYEHLHKIYQLATEIGINSGFSFVPPLQSDDNFFSGHSSMIKCIRSLNKALEIEQDHKKTNIVGLIPINHIPKLKDVAGDILENEVKYINRTGCVAMSTKLNINFNGDVYPCIFLQYPEFVMGNLKEKTIREIWNKPDNDVSTFREKRMYSSHKCGECELSKFCSGGCFGATYSKNKNFIGPDPRCQLRD